MKCLETRQCRCTQQQLCGIKQTVGVRLALRKSCRDEVVLHRTAHTLFTYKYFVVKRDDQLFLDTIYVLQRYQDELCVLQRSLSVGTLYDTVTVLFVRCKHTVLDCCARNGLPICGEFNKRKK